MIKIGNIVRFTPKAFPYAKERGKFSMGFFGDTVDLTVENNNFKVLMVNIQDEDSIELQLENYPWLVYSDEVELVKE